MTVKPSAGSRKRLPAWKRALSSSGAFLATGAAALVLLPWEAPAPLFRVGTLCGVTLPELMIGVFCLLYLASRRPWRLCSSGTVPAIAFVAILFLSAALAPQHRANAVKFAARMASGLLFAGAIASMAEEERGAKLARASIAASALVPALLGIAEWIHPAIAGVGPFQHPPYMLGNILRSQAVFPYPTIFSGFLEMALPFVIGSRAGPLLSALLAAGIFTSLSRASMAIALAIGLVLGMIGLRRRSFRFAAAGFAAPATLLILFFAVPSVRQGLFVHDLGAWYSARLRLQHPEVWPYRNEMYVLRLGATNHGRAYWNHSGTARFYVSYWAAPGACAPARRLTSLLSEDVPPGQETIVSTFVHLPSACSEVRLTFDMISENVTPFYAYGSPRLSLLFTRRGTGWTVSETPFARGEFAEQNGGDLNPLPSRRDLWSAAIGLWVAHPLLGVGPDNFRFLHGGLLPQFRGSDKVFSNNLFLELLSGCGILGLGAFLWMLVAGIHRFSTSVVIPSSSATVLAALSISAFCLHGLVDCMILFTPIYGLFWAAYGLLFAPLGGGRNG